MGFCDAKYIIFICEILKMLHMKTYLSTLLLVMFTGVFELYIPGTGCVSTSPTIMINSNTNNRKTLLISGIVLCRRNRDKTRAEHCKLVSIICWYDAARKFTSPYRHLFLILNSPMTDLLPSILLPKFHIYMYTYWTSDDRIYVKKLETSRKQLVSNFDAVNIRAWKFLQKYSIWKGEFIYK